MYVKVTGTPFDWNDPDAYSETAFYTKDVGREKLSTGVSERVRRNVQVIVEDPGMVDYHTTSDFVRDAVIHLMHKRLVQMTDPLRRQAIADMLEDLRKREATHAKVAHNHAVDAEAAALIELWERAIENGVEPDDEVLARTGELMREQRSTMSRHQYRQLQRLIDEVQLNSRRAAEFGIHLVD